MKPKFVRGNVQAPCPGCGGALSTFEYQHSGGEFGHVAQDAKKYTGSREPVRTIYTLLRCGGCGRGALATVLAGENYRNGTLTDFYPFAIDRARFPVDVPEGVVKEYREAELCAAVGAYRAASALMRSALEKALNANGYTNRQIFVNINDAAADGVITAARKTRAHADVRTLGNEIVHDPWREVDADEVATSLHFVQRIIEDLYDDRPTVEAILIANGRLNPSAPATSA